MKKRPRRSKIFNSINVILIALLFVELAFLVDSGITGNPIKSMIKKTFSVESSVGKGNFAKTASCVPSKEICDKKDNDCDKLVDGGGVCKTTQAASSATNSLGNLVTKEGTVELIIQDNFENPELSKEVYYLNENGKKYLLSTDTPLPVSAKIKVTGYLKDNTLSFSNSPTKASSLQGTSYTTTSATIEPWPKTLGEQKYLAVILRYENETFDFNVSEKIAFISNSIGDHIRNISYMKADFSLDYFGEIIISREISYSDFGDYVRLNITPLLSNLTNLSKYHSVIYYNPVIPGMWDGNAIYLFSSSLEYNVFDTWFLHELGHSFGLYHSSSITCGNIPNRKIFEGICSFKEYGDFYSLMGGSTIPDDYSIVEKLNRLGWLDDSNVPAVFEGTFFITPITSSLDGLGILKGVKIPLLWNTSDDKIIINRSQGSGNGYNINTLDEEGITHYYVEYRTQPNIWPIGNDTLNGKGVFIKLGGSESHNPLSLLIMNPNAQECWIDEYSDQYLCFDYSNYYSYLLKNETYSDSFNQMNITVLDMNESGALVKITKWPTCADTDGGSNIYTKGTVNATNSSGTYSYTDYCISSSHVKEYYCQNNQALSTNAYCSKGCSNYNGACTRPTSTGCYIDPKTKKKICPSQLT